MHEHEHVHEPNSAQRASVSAGRAVTWIMRSQYGNKSGWDTWFRAQTPSSSEADLQELFTRLRNRSQKSEPIVANRTARIEGDGGPPVEPDPKMPKVRLTLTSMDDSTSEARPPVVILRRRQDFKESLNNGLDCKEHSFQDQLGQHGYK